MTIRIKSCKSCIHIGVCNIYEFARKYNEDSGVKFKSSTMNEVCGKYRQGVIRCKKE